MKLTEDDKYLTSVGIIASIILTAGCVAYFKYDIDFPDIIDKGFLLLILAILVLTAVCAVIGFCITLAMFIVLGFKELRIFIIKKIK